VVAGFVIEDVPIKTRYGITERLLQALAALQPNQSIYVDEHGKRSVERALTRARKTLLGRRFVQCKEKDGLRIGRTA
jgi:hypothetical protein